ncbi:MATH domain and coiled-coil domain-containing protein At3g58370-like isoform X1 [Pyrus x bretschneideri]|uniref:MATH domain and coiled-coil domain-containing protein At3g58370-like isoform X1 n=2 Tax=Pyrus x bretschneideri TaxID=225117 RepID=UPI00202F19C6|nr:MATH domain and coiled-coil domain-containing protein At3g58370-like isoform X1 [Pyrus x bretschneideri]
MGRMRNEEGDVVCDTYTWKIPNLSKLKSDEHSSDVFIVGDIKWRILIRPTWIYDANPELEDQLSMYLRVEDTSTLPPGWTRCANFCLTLVNQHDSTMSITKSTNGNLKEFKEDKSKFGFKSFMPLRELYNSGAGFLVNDICIVQAKINVPVKIGSQETNVSATMESSKKELKGQESPRNSELQNTPGFQQACTEATDDSPSDPSLAKVLREVPTTPTGDLMDFRGLGRIERAFVPWLEEVCSSNPSLIDCMLKRTPMFVECAFTALGRVLHFLKTTKVKDMTRDACDRLQLFWEELEAFRFDLAWLEPHVHTAFGMNKFLQRTGRLKRLREDVDVLEDELKRRRAAVAVTKVDLAVAKKNLGKAEQEFNGIDMDGELGYGIG